VLEEGLGDLKDKPPTLLVLNKKDLIKPGEIAKKLEVRSRSLIFFGMYKCNHFLSIIKFISYLKFHVPCSGMRNLLMLMRSYL
jgi:ribosome biogenesis GTPase A